MIADDDAGIVDLLSIMLETEGYEVSSTLNGNSLLDIHSDLPDIILMDISMAGVDGLEVCRKLREKELTHQIPIVMVSGSDDMEPSVLDAGANDFLAKPFDLHELLEKIEKNLPTETGGRT